MNNTKTNENLFALGHDTAMEEVKIKLIKMIIENEREMTLHENLNSIFYYSDVVACLKRVYFHLFNLDEKDIESIRLLTKELEDYKKSILKPAHKRSHKKK